MRKDVLILLFVVWKVLGCGRWLIGELVPATWIRHGEKTRRYVSKNLNFSGQA